jgi:hypothetical protein
LSNVEVQAALKEHRIMLCRSNICRAVFLMASLLALMQFSPVVTAQEEAGQAHKFDDFGGLWSSCDFGARLDNLAIELQNNPGMVGYIICYGPEGKGSGTASFRLNMAQDYLLNTRGLDAWRIKTLYGGRYQDLKEVFTELWVVPHDAAPPEPTSYENNVKTFTGMFAEYEYWEGSYEEAVNPQGNVTFAGFADVLRQQPKARAYVVVQNIKEATPGAWRRAAKEVSDSLQSDYEITAERIKTICAGYDAKTEDTTNAAKVQLWILPPDAPPPVAEVTKPEPTPEEAVMWRSFNEYELKEASDKRRVFEGFADVLRSDKGLSVCIIVRQQSVAQENVEPVTEAEPEQNVEDEAPEVDLMELTGQWKSDLAKEYEINAQRFILLPAEAQDWNDNQIEIWLVPTGATLPDPYAENSVEADEAGEADGAQQEMPEAAPPRRM